MRKVGNDECEVYNTSIHILSHSEKIDLSNRQIISVYKLEYWLNHEFDHFPWRHWALDLFQSAHARKKVLGCKVDDSLCAHAPASHFLTGVLSRSLHWDWKRNFRSRCYILQSINVFFYYNLTVCGALLIIQFWKDGNSSLGVDVRWKFVRMLRCGLGLIWLAAVFEFLWSLLVESIT